MNINILGTEYDYMGDSEKNDVVLCDKNGYVDFYAKIIRYNTDYNENDPNLIKDTLKLINYIKRHEIIHAFFFESGMREWAENEALVDWVAIQIPKMLKTFKDVECL